MLDLDYWTAALRKAEQELDAAATRTAISAAAKRLMLAKRELKRLDARPPSGLPPVRSPERQTRLRS